MTRIPNLKKLFRGALDAAERRFRRARPASVLILVVALLVLMALIGTAFITTTGADRLSASQNMQNTEADLLIESLRQIGIATIAQGASPSDPPGAGGTPAFRPAVVADPGGAFNDPPTLDNYPLHYSHVDFAAWDAHLASRAPDETNTGGAPIASWRYLTASPLATRRGHPSDTGYPNPQLLQNQYQSPYVSGNFVANLSSRFAMIPDSVTITYPGGVQRVFPALRTSDVSGDPAGPNKLVLAADTDGDGIADGAFFKLPVPTINGVEYYGSLRIVDNAAAINPTVAWQPFNGPPPPGAPAPDLIPANIFPTNIDLASLVLATDAPAALQAYNTWRFNNTTSPNLNGINDNGTQLNGIFRHATIYDALWAGLGSRPDNPGYLTTGTNGKRYVALGMGEAANLASTGGVLTSRQGTSSTLERFFPKGFGPITTSNGPGQPFAANQFVEWYRGVYDYYDPIANKGVLQPANTPLRPLMAPHNGVAQFTRNFTTAGSNPTLGTPAEQERQRAGQYRYRGVYPGPGMPALPANTIFYTGDWVSFGSRAFVCIADHAAGVMPTGVTGAGLYWAAAPWYYSPVKVNPNTASFGSLKAAYGVVMGDGPEVRPGTASDPGYGETNEAWTKVWTFGNPLRPNGSNAPRALTPRQVKQLRAAMAAVNTIDLRDQDDDVTSRTLYLDDPTIGGTPRAEVRVYGTERQPYITSVTVHISETDQPWIMVELFNPYSARMPLDGFRLAYRDKIGGGFTPVGPKLTGKAIQGKNYIYFESDKSKRPLDVTNDGAITAKLDDTNVTTEIPQLEDLVLATGGARKDLYLLRTRQFNGFEMTNGNIENPFNEVGEGNLADWVPADQIDFTGVASGLNRVANPTNPAQMLPVPDRYHYRRATQDLMSGAGNRWHCVYGGPYNRMLNAAGSERPQRGFVRDPRPLDPTLNPLVPRYTPPGLGPKRPPAANAVVAHNDGTYDPNEATFRTRSLQVANTGAAGPHSMQTGDNRDTHVRQGTPVFPLGGFARVGDILQVTFTGGFRSAVDGWLDLQSISVDSAFAEDGDLADDAEGGTGAPLEQLGRFCPIHQTAGITDLDAARVMPSVASPAHRYAWAADLFDYFTVTSPQHDFYPNVDPNGPTNPPGGPVVTDSGDPTIDLPANRSYPKFPQQAQNYAPAAGAKYADGITRGFPLQVPNGPTVTKATDVVYDGREDTAAVHGLINLNTASWKVMSALPFTDNPTTNIKIAQMIVKYREAGGANSRGALRSLFDLNRVFDPGNTADRFETGAGRYGGLGNLDPKLADGDLSPFNNHPANIERDDFVHGDFEARYLMINRISNMVTFRSDSFTVYAMVQGWRNAGTDQPELVVQRRAASVVDRATIRPTQPAAGQSLTPATTVNVPQN